MKINKIIIYIGLFCIFFAIIFCNSDTRKNITTYEEGIFLNLHDTVDYVGMATCQSCHKNIHDSYIHTGMGLSFDKATKEKSSAMYGKHQVVYDKHNDFYYKPFFKDSTLYIKEYRLENGDTTHKRTEKISYIIGSGQHTNSHLIDINGYLYQAPITFYTQKGIWDMAPGYEDGGNQRFNRHIGAQCITCHNHLPDQVEGSKNKYDFVPSGIECERCHGPGELHVKEKLAGNIIDTSLYIDPTIVNPVHLPVDLQLDICQRCHLQGVAVLREGKSFYDFRPGMRLKDVMDIYLERHDNSDVSFKMASQAERLKQSDCYIISKNLNCLNCHNPHHSVQKTDKSQYNNACINCHKSAEKTLCSAPEAERVSVEDNCVGCHMPKSGSKDIPHVNITDHYISKTNVKKPNTISNTEKEAVAQFLGVDILTRKNPKPIDLAKGYLANFERFGGDKKQLDSALFYIKNSTLNETELLPDYIHYYHLKNDFNEIINITNTKSPNNFNDAWTTYRIGEAYFSTGQFAQALPWLEKTVRLEKYDLEFQEKLAACYLQLKKVKKAKEILNFIIKENPKRKIALTNLGYANALEGNLPKAKQLYNAALALDPDHVPALMNKSALLLLDNKNTEAKKLLNRVLVLQPDNLEVMKLLKQLN